MEKIIKTTFNIYQEDGELINKYDSPLDAYYGLKEVKAFDKREGIKTKYYFLLEEETQNNDYFTNINIFKKGPFIKWRLHYDKIIYK